MSTLTSEHKDQLINDLRAVMRDAQQLLDSGVASCSEQASQTRQRLESALQEARQSWSEYRPNVRQRLSQWQHVSDEYVHQHPWATMGVAIGMGVAMGWLIARR